MTTVIERSSPDADKLDSLFFETHPQRSHRLRLATRGEIRGFEHAIGPVPDDLFLVAAKQIEPGKRVCVMAFVRAFQSLDVDEENARDVFEWAMKEG